MQKEILTVIREEKIDIMQFYMELSENIRIHCQSVADLSAQLYAWSLEEGICEEEEMTCEYVRSAVLYHDIGLSLVPQRLIQKEEKLTAAEERIIQRHVTYGATLIDKFRTSSRITEDMDTFWSVAVEVALNHHERWDGRGYPYGQSTTAIPFLARITAIADAYNAIVMGSPYRMPLPAEYAVLEIQQNARKQFDPSLADLFRRHFLMLDD